MLHFHWTDLGLRVSLQSSWPTGQMVPNHW